MTVTRNVAHRVLVYPLHIRNLLCGDSLLFRRCNSTCISTNSMNPTTRCKITFWRKFINWFHGFMSNSTHKPHSHRPYAPSTQKDRTHRPHRKTVHIVHTHKLKFIQYCSFSSFQNPISAHTYRMPHTNNIFNRREIKTL